MFAVPGWNVPSSALATQTAEPTQRKAEQAKSAKEKQRAAKNSNGANKTPLGKRRSANGDDGVEDVKPEKLEGKKSKSKRKEKKKDDGGVNGVKVTDDNLQVLYEKIVEGKSAAGSGEGTVRISGKKKRKRNKKGRDNSGHDAGATGTSRSGDAKGKNVASVEQSASTIAPTEPASQPTDRPPRKKHKKSNDNKTNDPPTSLDDSLPTPIPAAVVPLSNIPALTPLQQKMRAKLTSARFRHLNESLYTTPSATSFDLFRTHTDMFNDYHAGFRQQVQIRPQHNGKPSHKMPAVPEGDLRPLPRPPPTYTCTIADLGCGDAKIASTLTPLSKSQNLNLVILSYDLNNASNPSFVTEADVANLPLLPESVDIAVFCLALMGTNYLDFIEEAYRVLRTGGELWIAEIKSRFTIPDTNGPNSNHAAKKNKKKKAGAEDDDLPLNKGKIGVKKPDESGDFDDFELGDDNGNRPLEGNDGAILPEVYRPFIAALARRGFVLRNGRVDDGNKMFVRMEFFKPRVSAGYERGGAEEVGAETAEAVCI
ncbi:methyltransferase-domain-containing protein [Kalaharituber pfeilii]|nr:methyltransferase-domain-containing protein [Kalaharituber pfeilii]